MKLSITLQGYRNFLEPVTISIGDGNIALIGPNNSGKSNLFRFIYEYRNQFASLPSLVGRDIQLNPNGVKDYKEYVPRSKPMPLKCVFKIEDSVKLNALIEVEIESVGLDNPTLFHVSGKYADGQVVVAGQQLPRYVSGNSPEFDELQKIMQFLDRSKYYGAARTSISSHGTGNHFDFISGLPLAQTWHNWVRGESLDNKNIAKKITQKLSEIFDLPNLRINANIDTTDLEFESNWKHVNLREMGFGVSQFFSTLINVAQQQPSILFIDEPETNLHASLQLKFFNALNEYCDSIVFSTHSIGLAKQVSQRIYSFIPNNSSIKVKEFVDPQFLPKQLGDLSFSAHTEIGFDKVLLVEGPTDIQVFQTILQTLQLSGKTVVLNLGGSSNINKNALSQIEELLRLMQFDQNNPNIAVIVDSENDGADSEIQMIQRVADFKQLLEDKGIPICVLKRRSIENYFSNQHLNSAGSNLQALNEFEAVPKGWEKYKNFKFAANMTKEEILNTDFGQFMVAQLS